MFFLKCAAIENKNQKTKLVKMNGIFIERQLCPKKMTL